MATISIHVPQPLSFGAEGVMVQYVQLALRRAGYGLAVDGILKDATQAAVRDFVEGQLQAGTTGEAVDYGQPQAGTAGTAVDYGQPQADTAGTAVDYGQPQVGTAGAAQAAAGPVVDAAVWQMLLPYLKGYRWYRVEENDSLWRIAGKFQTEISALLTANPGIEPEQLPVGAMLVVPFAFPLVSGEVDYTSFFNSCIIDGLEKRYPFLEAGSIGESVMAKPIPFLRIGKGEKEVFYNASFHANEWITTPVLLNFAERYARAYAGGGQLYSSQAAELFWKYSLYLVPMVNPDGVDLVNGVLSQVSGLTDAENEAYLQQAGRIAAKFPQIPYPAGWKANIDGVDLNLQFPAGWENAREIKFAQGYTEPAPRDYVGETPLSAPEGRAVYRFTLAHDFRLILAYHTQGEVIYWKYLDYDPAGAGEIVAYFERVSGYSAESTPLVSGYAGYKDWFIMEYVRPGYTVEAGLGENPLPMTQFGDIYEKNRLILKGGMTQL